MFTQKDQIVSHASKVSGRCTRCILPLDIPGAKPNLGGVCNYCLQHDATHGTASASNDSQSRQRLDTILRRTKGRARYDCLVPLSGGKDSTYMLYLAAIKYGLKVLAFNFNNGYQSNLAVQNMEQAVDISGADLVVYRINQKLMTKLFRTFLTKTGEFCSPCNLMMWDIARDIAHKNHIKLILSGNTNRMAAGIEVMSHSSYCDRIYFSNVVDGEIPKDETKGLSGPPYSIRAVRQILGVWPTGIDVLDYLNVSVEEITQTISKEFGWRKPGEEVEHGDCRIACLKDYIMCQKWGCSDITGHYCALIRNHQMPRENALERAKAEEYYTPPPVFYEFIRDIDVSEEEFNEAIKKDFQDIPNIRNTAIFRCAKKMTNVWSKVLGKR